MSYRIVYRVFFLNIPDEIDRPGTFNFDFVHQWVFVFVMNSVQKVCFYAYRRAKKLPLFSYSKSGCIYNPARLFFV